MACAAPHSVAEEEKNCTDQQYIIVARAFLILVTATKLLKHRESVSWSLQALV